MRIAFILFEDLTLLDLIGFYDPITRLKTMGFMEDMTWEMCARDERVRDERGMRVFASRVNEPLSHYDLLFVPGGMGTRKLQHDKAFIDWIRTAETVPLKISVCTGSLILGAAGYLQGKRVTTHPKAFADLRTYCPDPTRERIVDDGDVVTAGGVATSIDLGLHMVERLANAAIRRKIAEQMDYPY